MKNELIIARRTGHRKAAAAQRLRELLAQFGLEGLEQTRFPLPEAPRSPDPVALPA